MDAAVILLVLAGIVLVLAAVTGYRKFKVNDRPHIRTVPSSRRIDPSPPVSWGDSAQSLCGLMEFVPAQAGGGRCGVCRGPLGNFSDRPVLQHAARSCGQCSHKDCLESRGVCPGPCSARAAYR